MIYFSYVLLFNVLYLADVYINKIFNECKTNSSLLMNLKNSDLEPNKLSEMNSDIFDLNIIKSLFKIFKEKKNIYRTMFCEIRKINNDKIIIWNENEKINSMIYFFTKIVEIKKSYLTNVNLLSRLKICHKEYNNYKNKVEDEAIKILHNYCENYYNQSSIQTLRLYKRENAAFNLNLELKDKFFEGLKIFGNSAKANYKIAKFMGSEIHVNHVRLFRQSLKKEKRKSDKEQKQAKIKFMKKNKKCNWKILEHNKLQNN